MTHTEDIDDLTGAIMPKLLLCNNKECKKSGKCRRHANSGYRQELPAFYLIVSDPARCQSYYPVEKRK